MYARQTFLFLNQMSHLCGYLDVIFGRPVESVKLTLSWITPILCCIKIMVLLTSTQQGVTVYLDTKCNIIY